jgi:DNA polymerase
MSDQRVLREINRLLDTIDAWRHRGDTATAGPGPAPQGGAGSPAPAPASPGAATPGPATEAHPAADIPAPPAEDIDARRAALSELEEQVRGCTLCPLHEGRTNGVPGIGVLDPLVMVIGEGPGAEEDRRGLPFVGRAGQYLDKWLAAIGLSRDRDVYITNIVKCRPPGNRDPQPNEIAACTPYLRRQIDIIRPKTILAVGRFAASWLTGQSESLGKLRGRTFDFTGVPVVVTYHPSGVLRNPEYRRPVWDDLRRLREIYSERGGAGEGGGGDSAGGAGDSRPGAANPGAANPGGPGGPANPGPGSPGPDEA